MTQPRDPHPVVCVGGPYRGQTVVYEGNVKRIPVRTDDFGRVIKGEYQYERRWMGGRTYQPTYQWFGPINPEWT